MKRLQELWSGLPFRIAVLLALSGVPLLALFIACPETAWI